MSVRIAKKEDLPKILEINELSFPKPSDSQFLQRLENDIFIVFEGPEVQGFLIAGCCYNNVRASILKLAVRPEYRNKGAATRLLQELLDILSARQVHQVDVVVNGAWHQAISLYKKVGFKITSKVPLVSGDCDFYVMEGKLTRD